MKNFIWIAIFFTLGYATPIDQVGDNKCLPKSTHLNEIGKLKDELILAVRRKDFVKAEEITVKIEKIEDENNNLKNKVSKVMITSGDPRSSATRTEIVDVANGLTCSDMAEFPVELSYAVGANLGGTPVVCGGYGSSGYSEKCFRLTNSAWEEYASLKEKRGYAAAVMHNDKLHIFGGLDNSNYILQTSETISKDGVGSYGPDLPTGVEGHAMTKINATFSLLSGGRTDANFYSAQTWFYNHETETFTSGPDLLEGRYLHGLALNIDGVTKAKIAVVTGGWNGNGYLDSTEMLINGQWQTGPPLPKAIEGLSMMELNGDTYVFGGKSSSGYESSIHRLRCSSGTCTWTTLNQQLKVGRLWLVAMQVQDNFCT